MLTKHLFLLEILQSKITIIIKRTISIYILFIPV